MIRPGAAGGHQCRILDFDMTGEVATLRFNVIDVRGRELYAPVTLRHR